MVDMWHTLVMLLSVGCLFLTSAEVKTQPPLVDTLQGTVSGKYETSTKGRTFESYYGIPYAKPPLGKLRFMDPVPGDAWDGILDGGSLRKSPCLQASIEALMMSLTITPEHIVGDEDCLHLNVFTHKSGSKDVANTPVMVWIHGGGFQFGSDNWGPPHVMMNKDIVLVVLQYRLSSLGFLSTEDDVVPGNMGLKDQTLALSWVKQNIRSFGGDPNQVTIFGESAGGASVHMQILSPKSKGLFKRAIMHSGNALCPWAMGDGHLSYAKLLASDLGCPASSSTQDLVDCLQNAPVENLIIKTNMYLEHMILPNVWGPRVDGDYLPEAPEILVKEGRFKGLDVIAGVNRHEGAAFAGDYFWKPNGLADINENFDNHVPMSLELRKWEKVPEKIARAAFKFYLTPDDVATYENADKIIQLYSDRHFMVPHESLSKLTVKHKPEYHLYLYQLDHRGQRALATYPNGFGAHWVTHADDLFYFFDEMDTFFEMFNSIPMSETDLSIRDKLTTMWYNFAKTGNPTPDKSLGFLWRNTDHALKYLSLGPKMTMKQDDSRERIQNFWASLPTRQNRLLYPNKVKDLDTKRMRDEL